MKTIPTEAKVVFAVIAAILLAVVLMIVHDNGQDDTPRRSKASPATTWQKTSEGGNIVRPSKANGIGITDRLLTIRAEASLTGSTQARVSRAPRRA